MPHIGRIGLFFLCLFETVISDCSDEEWIDLNCKSQAALQSGGLLHGIPMYNNADEFCKTYCPDGCCNGQLMCLASGNCGCYLPPPVAQCNDDEGYLCDYETVLRSLPYIFPPYTPHEYASNLYCEMVRPAGCCTGQLKCLDNEVCGCFGRIITEPVNEPGLALEPVLEPSTTLAAPDTFCAYQSCHSDDDCNNDDYSNKCCGGCGSKCTIINFTWNLARCICNC